MTPHRLRSTHGSPVSNPQAGLTLMELVVAIAIIAGSFMILLEQRLSAVDRVHGFTQQRRIQALAREKLEEIVYGDEEERSGEFKGPPTMNWEAEFSEVESNEAHPLVECILRVTWDDEREREQKYELSTRVFPPERSPLLDEISNDNDNR